MVPLLLALLWTSGNAQITSPLTLPQAAAIALERNPARKLALADTHAAHAEVRVAQSAFFPHLGFSEAVTRSNDPVYVFGTRLRQSRFTAQDFALNRLNNPTPISNFATRFSATWNVFDSLVSVHNLDRARDLDTAAAEQLKYADQKILFGTVQAYYGVLLAARQLDVAQHSVVSAEAVVEQSKARVQTGMVVDADLLSAQVNLDSQRQEAVRAQNALQLARAKLNIAMGLPAGGQVQPADELGERSLPTMDLGQAEQQALHDRPDLRQIALDLSAQNSAAKSAKAALGPRLNVFAASELDNVSPFGNGNNNWLAGAELDFDIFSGGEKAARVARANAGLERAEAVRRQAEDAVRLEVRSAYYEYDSARQMIQVFRGTREQADEALRIVRNRYQEGLTTITEVLRAEDAANAASTAYWDAVYRCNVQFAALELATGSLNLKSPVVVP